MRSRFLTAISVLLAAFSVLAYVTGLDAGSARGGKAWLRGVTLSNNTFVGGVAGNTVVGAVGVTVKGGTFTGTLSLSGTHAASFNLSSTTLPANLRTTGTVAAGTYNVNIVATQSGAVGSPLTVPFVITGTGAASITAVTLSNNGFTGNSPPGTVVGNIGVTMSAGTFGGTLSITGADAASFALSSTTLPSSLVTVGTLAAGTYNINLVATQTGAGGSPFSSAKVITGSAVTNSIANVTLSNSSFAGGSSAGTTVGTISVALASGTYTGNNLSLSGADASKFTISGTTLKLAQTVAAGTYSINIIAVQAGLTNSPFTSPKTITGTSTQTSTLVISGQNGATYSGLNISTTSGDCVQIVNSSNITIKNSLIGPCGQAGNNSNSRGIWVNASNTINIQDSYIHVDNFTGRASGSCSGGCDTHDNILVNGGSYSVNIRGNVIAKGESNIVVNNVPAPNHVVIDGNYLFDPRGPLPRGQNIQVYGEDASNRINFVTVTNNYTNCVLGDGFCLQEDSLSFGYLGNNVLVDSNWVRGGQSASGCGITFDVGMLGGTISNNRGLHHNCVIQWTSGGTNTGTGVISGNKGQVVAGGPNGAALIMGLLGFHTTPCGGVNVTGNIFSSTGGNGGQYTDNGCAPFVYSGNTIDPSYGICQPGYGSTPAPSCAAYATLNPLTTTDPPPLIPPVPVACVIASPYTTQTSLPGC